MSPLEYAPYTILCWSVPVIAFFYAVTGMFVWKEDAPLKTDTADTEKNA